MTMKETIYLYNEPSGDNYESNVVVRKTKQDILDEYWSFWYPRMVEKYGAGHELITEANCIEDWAVVHWAWTEDEENEDDAINPLAMLDLKDLLKEKIANVTFRKKDDTLRNMRCTLQSAYMPVKDNHVTEARQRMENPDMIVVWDIDNGGFRSFYLDSIQSVSVEP